MAFGQRKLIKSVKPEPKVAEPAAPAPKPELIQPWSKDELKKQAVFSFIALLAAIVKCHHDKKPVSDVIRYNLMVRWLENISYLKAIVGLPIDETHMEILARALQDGAIDEKAEGYMLPVGKALMVLQKTAVKDHSWDHDDLAALSAVGIYFRKKSPSSWKNITRIVERINVPELTAEFAPPIAGKNEFGVIKQDMNSLVRQLLGTKTDDYLLTFQEARTFKDGTPKREMYLNYLKLKTQLRNLWNDAVISILRRAGAVALPIDNIKATLHANGIDVYFLPEGFEGRVGVYDKKICLFTEANRPIQGRPQPGRRVIMNRAYDATKDNMYVFKAIEDETGKYNQFYTYEYRRAGQEKKFNVVRIALEDIDSYRKRWEAPLLQWSVSTPISLSVMLSAMAVMCYETQARIGGVGNKSLVKKGDVEKEKNTFGLSTLRMGHVKKLDKVMVRVTYSGKKAVTQTHIVKADSSRAAKKLIMLLNKLAQGKKPKDFLWSFATVKRGNHVSASDFNKFLREVGLPSAFTAHKIRHAKGTKIAREIIANKKFHPPKDVAHSKVQYTANEWYKKQVAEAVAIALGHRTAVKSEDGKPKPLWSTSVKSYIDPALTKKWFLDHNLRPPTWVPRI